MKEAHHQAALPPLIASAGAASLLLALFLDAGRGGALLIEALFALAWLVLGQAALQRLVPEGWRARGLLILLYLWALWFYLAVERLTPALGLPSAEGTLLAIDTALFGQTPSVFWAPSGITLEVLSACYLGYHLYLHGALGWALLQEDRARQLLPPLFFTFGAGYLLYLAFPAQGPVSLGLVNDHAALYAAPLAGGWLFEMTQAFVQQGSSVYDAFPSMHAAITLTLLAHDRKRHPKRFAALLIPALGLLISTIFLRYHYAIDVVAGGMIATLSLFCARASGAPK